MKDKIGKGHILELTYGLLFIAAAALGIISKIYYKNYIHIHHINDFGLAGSLPSFLYVTGFIFFYFFITHLGKREISYKTVVAISVGVLFYELLPLSSERTIDLKDIIAIVLGALMAYCIYYFLEIRTNTK